MAETEARAVSPADIIELIRKSADKGFTGRDFSAASKYSNSFSGDSITQGATRIEPEVVSDTDIVEPEPVEATFTRAEIDAEIEAARAAAFAEGEAKAKEEYETAHAELNATLDSARTSFLGLAHRLREVHPDDSALLAQTIQDAVMTLTRERIGNHINDAPEAFVARITALAMRITQGVQDVKLRLSADDIDAISPFIADSELLSESVIKPDPGLGRGDVILSAGALRLEDILTLDKSQS